MSFKLCGTPALQDPKIRGGAGLEKGLELQLVLWASSSHILLISRMTCLYPCTLGKKALKVTCLARKFTCPGTTDVTSFELSEGEWGENSASKIIVLGPAGFSLALK